MGRFQELLRAANNLRLLAAVGRSGGELSSIGDLIDSFENSPQLAESVRRFRAVPGGAELLEQRYPPLQPDIGRLRHLPPGSLGRRYADLILSLGYDPEFFRPRDTSDPGRWLTQRIATTHDVHHVITGFGTEPEGENGVLTITATQIGFPGYVLLTTAGQLANFRFQPERYERISRAVAHGAAIARQVPCLAAVRWEEGWEKPVHQWREELGLTDPADGESYGLDAQLGALP
ncbi:MAG: Coq4 family protein [Synechococcus sp.]